MSDGTVKVSLGVSPVRGRANRALSDWLASQFGTLGDDVKILTGLRSTRKTVRISNPRLTPVWFNGG